MIAIPLRKQFILSAIFILAIFLSPNANAQTEKPDTVRAGVYITSIHDINFKDKEYTVSLWLWLKYKNKKFDFLHNLEVPQAKTVTQSYSTVDSSDNKVYILMKLQCVMKDSWAIDNFPFDQQKLRFSIENSQFDSQSLVFVADTLGKAFDPRFTLRGWNIDSTNISTGIKQYETAFGDESVAKPHTEYSNFKVTAGCCPRCDGLVLENVPGHVCSLPDRLYVLSTSIRIASIRGLALSVGALFRCDR
jgi:hypothetical protein